MRKVLNDAHVAGVNTHLKGRCSISLFHYRNHGAAYGRVLAGFLVPESDQPEFEQFLQATAYPCQAVDDPACELFVGNRTLEREHAVDASLPG